jgi:hypothetical protein
MKYLVFSFASLLLLPGLVSAAEVFLEPQSLPVTTGDSATFLMSVSNPTKPLNAVEGSVQFDSAKLEFIEAKTGGGVVSFWIEYPHVCELNRICFSGISPGGFSDVRNELLTLTFLPKNTGTTTLTFDAIRLLQHDGKGTDEVVEAKGVALVIEEGWGGRAEQEYDTEPPEAFTPTIISDKDVYGGASSLIFSTTDKQTDVVAYYVKEVPFSWLAVFFPWKEARAPYLLLDQTLSSYIFVKAVDKGDNERVATVLPTNQRSYNIVMSGVLLLGMLLLLLLWKRVNRRSAT